MPVKLFWAIFIFFCAGWGYSDGYEIDLEGPINDVRADCVVHGIEKAEREAEFVILRINTPGGFDQAMRKIIEKILGSKIPVVAFVGPSGARAASAGFFILLSADIAVMAPGTNTGAAHPVLAIGGVYPIDGGKAAKNLTQKAMNDARAFLRGIVEKRGRDPKLAEEGIIKSRSYTEKEALDGKLIDFVAKDENELKSLLQGREIKRFDGQLVTLQKDLGQIRPVELTWRQKILIAISDPNLALILGLAGVLLLYFEFSNPGLIAPAVLGILSILLSLIGFSILPINFVGALLILFAAGFFIAEIKVQGFGILGLAGIASLLIGSLILIDTPQPELGISLKLALSVVVPFAVILMILMRLAFLAQRKPAKTGVESMIGLVGIVHRSLSPEGLVFVRGEYWNAVSREGIPEGEKVKIVRVEDLKLYVEKIKD